MPNRDRRSLGGLEIGKRFRYPLNTGSKQPQHHAVSIAFAEIAEEMDRLIPEGRVKYLVFTSLEVAWMWAHKGVEEIVEVTIPTD